MLPRRALVIASVVACAVVGLVISVVLDPPLGADHSCPAGSSRSACHYPGSQTSWSILWTVGGLIVGFGLGLIAAHAAKRRLR